LTTTVTEIDRPLLSRRSAKRDAIGDASDGRRAPWPMLRSGDLLSQRGHAPIR
jgi:hypothetical protein